VSENVNCDFSDGPPEQWLADQNGSFLQYIEVEERLAAIEAKLPVAESAETDSLLRQCNALRTLKRALASPATDDEAAFAAEFKTLFSMRFALQMARRAREEATSETVTNEAAAKEEAATAAFEAQHKQFNAILAHFGAL
jgi:hypothetical protein